MGNDNPIQNDKLLREAYNAGRRQALNEMSQGGGGPSFQQAPMNPMAYGTGTTRGGGFRRGAAPPDIPKESPDVLPPWIPEGEGYHILPGDGKRPPYIMPSHGKWPHYYWDSKQGRWLPVML